MRSPVAGIVVALLATAGCGGGSSSAVCDTLAKGLNDLISKATPCYASPPPAPITADQCRQQIGNCSDSDRQKLSDFGSCLSAMPTCNPAALGDWQGSLQTCLGKLQGISDSC